MNNLAIHRETMREFDYNALDSDISKFLQDKEMKIKQSASTIIYHYTQLGKYFKETQDVLSKNGYGCFAEWFTSLGFKKDNVYNLIGRYNLIVGNYDKRDLIETLPVSLTYEMAKKSADPKLNEKVFNGEIVNLKEYRQLKKQKKEAEQQEQLAGQLDIADIVEVTAIEVVQDKQIEVIEVPQDTQSINIDTIYNIALSKLEEINIRQGEFYHDGYGFLEVSDISSLIITMHLNKELTLNQMTQIAQKYELDIPIVFSTDQEVLKRYYEQLDKISNSYRQYIEKDTYNYDVVESYELDYATVVLCEFEDDLKLRKEYQDNMQELLISEDNITFTIGYDDSSTENLVIYRDKKLIANYKFHCPETDKYHLNNFEELENYITKLFELDSINNKYINVLHKLKCRCDKANKEYLQTEFKRNKEKAKFIYEEKSYTFLIMPQRAINKGDRVLVYKRDNEIGSCDLKEYTILGEFCFIESELNFGQDLEEIRDKIDKQIWANFTKEAIAKHKHMEEKAKEERQRQEQYKNYSNNYDYSKMFSSSSSSGNKLIDGIAKLDTVKKKNIYKALSKQLHPDLGGTTELMQFVTDLKQEWGI